MVELKYSPEEARAKAEQLIAQRAEEKVNAKRRIGREWASRDYRANPEKYRQRGKERYQKNRDDVREYNANYYAQNRDRVRTSRLMYKYGLTLEERDRILLEQGNRCANPGCRTDDPGPNGWCVDHCHTTRKFRAILCNSCNISLGFAKEDPNRLRGLADYKEKFSGGEWGDEVEDQSPDTRSGHSSNSRLQPPAGEHQEAFST